MKFWDSSAIVPLLVGEANTPAMQAIVLADPAMLVWWASEVECVSAITRLEREQNLSGAGVARALDRLDAVVAGWSEVQPVEAVRRTARRLLRTHPLRAVTALQLAAAVAAAEGDPSTLQIATLDDRLRDAARREGFMVVDDVLEDSAGDTDGDLDNT